MKRSLFVPSLCLSLLLPLSAGAAIHRVRLGATGLNNGSSWENARTDLHAALLAAAPGDSVWVAAGMWHADWNDATKTRTGDRERRFTLKTGVTVLGGFAGTETDAGQRDWWNHRTILNGELGAAGGNDNTRTIMATPARVAGCVLDGLTFIGGRADNPQEIGSGDLIGGNGGALFLRGEAIVQNCVFLSNSATYGGAIKVTSDNTAHLRLRQCLFAYNDATSVGGALHFHAWQQQLEITACTFQSNLGGRTVSTNSPLTALWKGNLTANGQTVEPGVPAATVTQWNVWGGSFDGAPPSGEGNIQDFEWQFLNSVYIGADSTWDTADDILLLELMARSSAINRVPVSALPPDITDADGDGNTTEPIPYDLSHRPRVRDGAADAGAFEMVNEAPTGVTFTPANTLEAEPADTLFGAFSVADPNGPGHTLSLVAGAGDTDNALFRFVDAGLLTAAELDYETKPTVSIRVRAVDLLGLSVEQQLTLPVKNRIERTLHLEVLQGSAWEPAGGVTGRTGPGGWPEHWASVRLVRTGDPGPVDVTLQVNDRTYIAAEDAWPSDEHGGREFRIHSAGQEVYPAGWDPPVIHMDAAQNEVLLGIEPLFDLALDESAGEVEIVLTDGGADYQTGTPASAVVTLYDSPSRAWAALPGRSALPPDQLAAFALGGRPDGSGPGLQMTLLPAQQQVEITGALHPAARDVSLSWERSADLQSWAAVQPSAVTYSGAEARWRFPVTGARAFFRPRGAVSALATGIGAGIASSFAYIAPGLASFVPALDEPVPDGGGAYRYQQLRPFWIARTELRREDTAGLDVFLTAASDAHPVVQFTPGELSLFLQKATSQQLYGPLPPGYELRLPTEAEWLYAASLPVGVPAPEPPLASRAWYVDNAFGIVHRTGQKLPDARGLYDMLGNVSEWTRGRLQRPAGATIADDTSIVSDNGWPAVCGGNVLLGGWAQTIQHRFSYPITDPSPVIGVRLVIAPVLVLP